MNIARVLYPVEVLGPGKRVGIWVSGCPHHCVGCSNPELWEKLPEYEIDVFKFYHFIKSTFKGCKIDGFVITGGDPLFQAHDLSELLPLLKSMSNDILVYTGYEMRNLCALADPDINKCLQYIDVLIDGPYIEALNCGLPMRGSSNQNIIYLNSTLQTYYEDYMKTNGSQIQNFPVNGGIISVGIHNPDFSEELKKRASEKGVVIDDA